jgi:hypothetical protein
MGGGNAAGVSVDPLNVMMADTLHDDVFGQLCYDAPMSEWYTEVSVTPELRSELAIWWDETRDGPFSPVLERARTCFLTFIEREPKHRQALAAALIHRYQGWKPKGEELPDPDEIARGLTVRRIAIAADGSALVHYDDAAELFGDHTIFADLDSSGVFVGFSLQG